MTDLAGGQILVHGEQHNMMRLKSKLLSLNATKTNKVKVFSPRNCEELRIPFKADKTAKIVGRLASIPPPPPSTDTPDNGPAPLVTGVLVQNDFKLSLMAPEDLREYAGLNTTTIICRQRLRLSAAGIDLIKWALEGTFGAIEELPEMRPDEAGPKSADESADGKAGDDGVSMEEKKTEEATDDEPSALVAAYLVMGCIAVRYRANGEVELEWEGNMLNDCIADSVMAALFNVESSPAAVKRSSAAGKHSHSHDQVVGRNPHANCSPAERLERLMWFLEVQFGAENVTPIESPRLGSLALSREHMARPAVKVEEPAAGKIEAKEKEKEEEEEEVKEEATTKKEDEGEKEEQAAAAAVPGQAEEKADQEPSSELVPTVLRSPADETAETAALKEKQERELQRLHKLGIPVPGVRIRVDKMEARVWLEDLEVECGNKVFADRVRAVMERAVEVTAPLWA